MIRKVEGIVIKETDYKETSKIINIFTKEGIIGILAKGAKRLKSPFVGATSKLTYAYFHINYKENSMSTLIEVDIIDTLKNLKKDITKISYASFITDLTYQVYKHENNNSLYELYKSSIIKINEGYDPLVITNILELKYLDYLGIRPIISKCVICGKDKNRNTLIKVQEDKNIITISSYKGGYICKSCHTNEKIISLKALKLIKMFYYIDISKISKTDISANVKKEINTFIDEYYDRYAGLYLKSKSFLNNLSKANII